MLTPLEVAKLISRTLDSKKAKDIKVMKTENLTVLANYFVICTATSSTQIKTISDEVEKILEENGEKALHKEGYRFGGWVLIDYGCVVVHIFMPETREFYGLERLWADAEEIDIDEV